MGENGLGVKVHIELNVAILFGLEISASIFSSFEMMMEGGMKNSIAFAALVAACVWCEIAFLRSLW